MILISSALTSSNIFQNGWDNIFSIINELPDPENRNKKWVFSAFPDTYVEDSSGNLIKEAYPLLIVKPFDISNYRPVSLKGVKEITLPLEIQIYTIKSLQLDTIGDDIFDSLEDNEDTLFSNGLKDMKIIRSSYAPIERGGVKIHLRATVYGFTFDVM